jgi:hypothetical protein
MMIATDLDICEIGGQQTEDLKMIQDGQVWNGA